MSGKRWTDDEIRAAVDTYVDVLEECRRGATPSKTEYLRRLARDFPTRTLKSFEWRMQNISYVMCLLGLEPVPGWPPARNVGPGVAERIARALEGRLGRTWLEEVSYLVEAQDTGDVAGEPPAGKERPARSEVLVVRHARDAGVARWVRARAAGRCELCGRPAPFTSRLEEPYLEIHHVVPLAEGGPDTVDNTAALCPNCHRELHSRRHAREKREELVRNLRDRDTPPRA